MKPTAQNPGLGANAPRVAGTDHEPGHGLNNPRR
jgi:hypothetical protein